MPFTDDDLKNTLNNIFKEKGNITEIQVCEEKNLVASSSRGAIVVFDDGTKKNLHIKLCEDGKTPGYLNAKLKIFDREEYFYKELLPLMITFQEEENIPKSSNLNIESMFLPFHGSETIDGIGSLLVLDRFTPEEFFVTKPEDFHTLQQIHHCMNRIASFHATSLAMKIKQGINWKLYNPYLPDVLFHKDSLDVSKAYFSNIFASNVKILRAIKSEVQSRNKLVENCILSFNSMSLGVLEKLELIVPKLPEILSKTLECSSDLEIVTHGDFHMWNIAFSNQGEMAAKFFDMQMMRTTSGLIDIHHLLSQVCTPATRNQHLHEFLNTYYRSLKQGCLDLGVSESEIPYTRKTVDDEYILRSPWGFVFGFCFILPRFISNQQLASDFYSKLNDFESSGAIVDWISKNASPNIWSVLEMYVDMVQIDDDLGTLDIMEKLGEIDGEGLVLT